MKVIIFILLVQMYAAAIELQKHRLLASTVVFHVDAIDGRNEDGDGPFETTDFALEQLATLNNHDPNTKHAVLILESGSHSSFSVPSDSLKGFSSLTIRGRGIANTAVSGGIEIPRTLFHKNEELSAHTQSPDSIFVYTANISSLNISSDDLYEIETNGCVRALLRFLLLPKPIKRFSSDRVNAVD